MKKPKVQKAYRLQERTVRLIEAIAVEAGYSAQADTIDMWAKEWVERNGKPTWWDEEEGTEKKSGRRGEVFQEDVPDEVMRAGKPKRAAELLKTVPGLKAGSALAISPVGKRAAKTVVRDMDLATGRIDRKPITRPNGKI